MHTIKSHTFECQGKLIFCPFYELDIFERAEYARNAIENGYSIPFFVNDEENEIEFIHKETGDIEFAWYPKSYEDRVKKSRAGIADRKINII